MVAGAYPGREVPGHVPWWQRISVRIGVGAMLVLVAALVVVGWLVTRQEERLYGEQHTAHAHKISSLVAEGLVRRILAGGGAAAWDGVTREASTYIETAGVGRISVLARNGSVKASTDPSLRGGSIEVAGNPACPGCDGMVPEQFPVTRAVVDAAGQHWLRVVSAVPARPECKGCHQDPGEKLRGLVLVDFDLTPLNQAAAERRRGLLLIGLACGLVSLVLIYWLFRRSVLEPVEVLVDTAGRLAGGDLQARAPVAERGELGHLAAHFNHMVDRIEDQVARLESSNLESGLLYTLVVEVSRNMEMSAVASTVVRVLEQKLAPAFVAFFAESADGTWVCASDRSEALFTGEGALAPALLGQEPLAREALDGFPLSMAQAAVASLELQLGVGGGALHFAVPLGSGGRLSGLLVCSMEGASRVQADEELLANLGGHLTLAVENSRNYTGAVTDPLTRCRNRRYGLARLDEAAYASRRHEIELAVAMLDIDHFKRINDSHGHPAGDQVLRETARRLMDTIRKADVPIRYGGEEFLVILPQTREEDLAAVGERLRAAVGAAPVRVVLPGNVVLEIAVSVSVGLASYRGEGDEADALIARADQALYRAKAGGRNRVEVVGGDDGGQA